MPVPHPSAVQPSTVDDVDSDYHRLVNTVERHTRCSAAYCLRKKHLNVPAECRFGFPKGLEDETKFNHELLPHNKVTSSLVTKRNDHRLNSHNRVMLENWRANVDLQVIVDQSACARYMAKYAAKGEPRSKQASEIVRSCVSTLPDDGQVSSAIKKAVIQVAGDRDMAAQETAHMLLSIPLTGCTYSFVTVSLDNSRRVVIENEQNGGGEVLQKSPIEEYGKRMTSNNASTYCGLSQLNLMQYVSQYRKVGLEIRTRASPVIVRTFPKVSPNPKGPDFGRYCKYQLIKFKPWLGEPSNAWDNVEESDEVFIAFYYRFLQTDFAEENVIGHDQEWERVDARVSGGPYDDGGGDAPSDSDDDAVDNPRPEETEDWMLLCRLNQHYEQAGNPLLENTTDWFEAARLVPSDLLKESPGWICQQRKDAEEQGEVAQLQSSGPPIDPSTLNQKQELAYEIVKSHAESVEICEPVNMIVCGTAGTGKTYLISALKQILGNNCIVTATTGIAAFSINGQTLHSAAYLPIREYRELQGESLQRLQLKLQGKAYLIVDEMSMIGHRMLSSLDNRLRAGTGNLDKPFGGISVILLGDFGQLPPVGDRPLYVPGNGSTMSDHGHSLYLLFDTVVILDEIMRQVGTEAQAFRGLLMRMRDGKVTEEDWHLLLQHSTTNVDMAEFKDSIRLYFDKKSVADYNYEKLRENGQAVAKIEAKHSGRGASASTSDEAGGLDAVIFLSKNAEVMLTSNLWTDVGLCNGSFGVVEEFWYAENVGPPNLPIAVLVHFPAYTGPRFMDVCPKCLPVPPKVFEWMADGKYLSRQQIPLRLRYAMTIHKSQGQTLPKVVVDLGKGEKVAGCTFVATSRVRSINNIVFEPMTFDRLKAIGRNKNMQKRIDEEHRLALLSEQTVQKLL